MYKRILVPLDGSDTAERGLTEAIALAQPLKARLLLLSVIADLGLLVEMASVANADDMRRGLRRYAEDVLARARQTAAGHDVEADTIVRDAIGGRAAPAIVEEARVQGCDMIVMGTHGRRGLGRLVLGSDAMAVLHASPLPVLLVRERQPDV